MRITTVKHTCQICFKEIGNVYLCSLETKLLEDTSGCVQ